MLTQTTNPIASMLQASEWSSLARYLRDFAARAEDLCYVPNCGNAGDALIASATWQLFDAIGLRPRITPAAQLSKGVSVIYGGGGNLTPDYGNCARFLRRCMAVRVREAVVLPQTIRGHVELLQQLDERFTLVCRDLPSLEWCTTTARAAKTMFSHDLALLLDVRSLQRRCRGLLSFAALLISMERTQGFSRYRRWRHYTGTVQPRDGTLQVFRTDVEAVSRYLGDPLQDISAAYVSEYLYRAEHDFVARDLLRTIGRADVIVTNRLHVGIAGALLGKRVRLYDNSYGKVHDVYQASLKGCALVSFAGN
jgi:exopolysaccharide biosynthesis predicted pyruvyltransferase EpsI